MTRRSQYAGTVLELGVVRPVLFLAACYALGSVVGTAQRRRWSS